MIAVLASIIEPSVAFVIFGAEFGAAAAPEDPLADDVVSLVVARLFPTVGGLGAGSKDFLGRAWTSIARRTRTVALIKEIGNIILRLGTTCNTHTCRQID